ncbi:MAG: glycosyltransferase family 2 protein [Bacteroidaceae bacterium]|nr:glycosyltransferase family 2 protein [Bacteroidaceae bacterium]
MQQECIGIIVPVYKAEKYIAECIDSILAQRYTDFRLILVDDGTPDGAGIICDEYAKKDSRITVVHQENSGATRARERGVREAADCEFITFVDSDDTIAPNYLDVLHNAVCNDVNIVTNEPNITATSLNREKYLEHLFVGGVDTGPCSKLFRRKLFNSRTFDIPRTIVVGEDVLMDIRLAFASDKDNIAITNNSGIYHYRENECSIMHTFRTTPAYEHLFQQSLAASIPEGEKNRFFRLTIQSRLRHFKHFWGKKLCVKGMKETEFYRELVNDINEFNYQLPAAERTLLVSENPIVRLFALTARGVMKIFRK